MGYTFHFGDVFAYWPLLLQGSINTLLYSAFRHAGRPRDRDSRRGLAQFAVLPASLDRCFLCRAGAEHAHAGPAFVFFFALPSVGVRLSSTTAALLALTFNNGAYMTEIVRSGIENVHRSQREAALSLGLTRWHIFRHVVLFQALEKIYPAMIGQFTLLMLSSSLISSIGADDLTAFGSRISPRTSGPSKSTSPVARSISA